MELKMQVDSKVVSPPLSGPVQDPRLKMSSERATETSCQLRFGGGDTAVEVVDNLKASEGDRPWSSLAAQGGDVSYKWSVPPLHVTNDWIAPVKNSEVQVTPDISEVQSAWQKTNDWIAPIENNSEVQLTTDNKPIELNIHDSTWIRPKRTYRKDHRRSTVVCSTHNRYQELSFSSDHEDADEERSPRSSRTCCIYDVLDDRITMWSESEIDYETLVFGRHFFLLGWPKPLDHEIQSSLNGNNGSWTNTDDVKGGKKGAVQPTPMNVPKSELVEPDSIFNCTECETPGTCRHAHYHVKTKRGEGKVVNENAQNAKRRMEKNKVKIIVCERCPGVCRDGCKEKEHVHKSGQNLNSIVFSPYLCVPCNRGTHITEEQSVVMVDDSFSEIDEADADVENMFIGAIPSTSSPSFTVEQGVDVSKYMNYPCSSVKPTTDDWNELGKILSAKVHYRESEKTVTNSLQFPKEVIQEYREKTPVPSPTYRQPVTPEQYITPCQHIGCNEINGGDDGGSEPSSGDDSSSEGSDDDDEEADDSSEASSDDGFNAEVSDSDDETQSSSFDESDGLDDQNIGSVYIAKVFNPIFRKQQEDNVIAVPNQPEKPNALGFLPIKAHNVTPQCIASRYNISRIYINNMDKGAMLTRVKSSTSQPVEGRYNISLGNTGELVVRYEKDAPIPLDASHRNLFTDIDIRKVSTVIYSRKAPGKSDRYWITQKAIELLLPIQKRKNDSMFHELISMGFTEQDYVFDLFGYTICKVGLMKEYDLMTESGYKYHRKGDIYLDLYFGLLNEVKAHSLVDSDLKVVKHCMSTLNAFMDKESFLNGMYRSIHSVGKCVEVESIVDKTRRYVEIDSDVVCNTLDAVVNKLVAIACHFRISHTLNSE